MATLVRNQDEASRADGVFEVIHPATAEIVAQFHWHSSKELTRRVERTAREFTLWRQTSIAERAAMLRHVAKLLRDKRDAYARLITGEMGKPIVESRAEIDKCAWGCDYYADHAAQFLEPEGVETDGAQSFIRFEPLGVILAVMPWNFPFWQVFRFAAPALAAGNAILLKHASSVPGCAAAIERLFERAGSPHGVFANLRIPSDEVETVIRHPAVRGVTLTGSEQAGAAIASQAGKHLHKCVLELGGSDPFIVLDDVNVDEVAARAAAARTQNAGQSCIAAKRFIVLEGIADRFEKALTEKMKSLRIGDPYDEHTHIGPLARGELREALDQQVSRSIKQGAQLLCGGRCVDGPGFFYWPTVLSQVTPGMPVFDEETFGPVAAVVRAIDPEHAVHLANQSKYGLGASVWTKDIELGMSLVEDIEAGCVFINDIVKSDPRLPFGGVKRSGYGRELSVYGIREFVNIKTVRIGS